MVGKDVNNKKSSPNADDAISSRLKEYYSSLEEEPIPSQLLDLLEKLSDAEEKVRNQSQDSGNAGSKSK